MTSKFSYIEDLYEAMEGFIVHLAHRYANEDLMFEFDELVGELNLELVKGFNFYKGKNLTDDQLMAVIRRILDNRIGELRYKYYKTHRAQAKFNISIDVEVTVDGGEVSIDELIPSEDITPEQCAESKFRVDECRSKLSPLAQQVFDLYLIGDNERLSKLIQLDLARAAAVGRTRTYKIKPRILSDTLLEDEKKISKAMHEISAKYAEVCNA